MRSIMHPKGTLVRMRFDLQYFTIAPPSAPLITQAPVHHGQPPSYFGEALVECHRPSLALLAMVLLALFQVFSTVFSVNLLRTVRPVTSGAHTCFDLRNVSSWTGLAITGIEFSLLVSFALVLASFRVVANHQRVRDDGSLLDDVGGPTDGGDGDGNDADADGDDVVDGGVHSNSCDLTGGTRSDACEDSVWPRAAPSTLATTRIQLVLRYSLVFCRTNWILVASRIALTVTFFAMHTPKLVVGILPTIGTDPFGMAILDIFLVCFRGTSTPTFRALTRTVFVSMLLTSLAAYAFTRMSMKTCQGMEGTSSFHGHVSTAWDFAWNTLGDAARLLYLVRWLKIYFRKIVDPSVPSIAFASGPERVIRRE